MYDPDRHDTISITKDYYEKLPASRVDAAFGQLGVQLAISASSSLGDFSLARIYLESGEPSYIVHINKNMPKVRGYVTTLIAEVFNRYHQQLDN